MKRIELDPYEEKDLLQVLNYAQEEYRYRQKFDLTGVCKYWIQRIEQLKKVVRGKKITQDNHIQSSLKDNEQSTIE